MGNSAADMMGPGAGVTNAATIEVVHEPRTTNAAGIDRGDPSTELPREAIG